MLNSQSKEAPGLSQSPPLNGGLFLSKELPMSPIAEQIANPAVSLDPHTGPTGPRTPAGKSRCRLNAVRHGLTGQSLYFTPEEAEAFTSHSASIQAHYQPHGPIEEALVRQIADAIWRLDRASAIEHGIFALALESPEVPDEDPDPTPAPALSPARTWLAEGKNLALLTLYVKRIENKLDANKAELSLIQHNRKQEAAEAMQEAVTLHRAAAIEGKPYEPAAYFTAPPPVRESVFSDNLVSLESRRRQVIQDARGLCMRNQFRPAA